MKLGKVVKGLVVAGCVAFLSLGVAEARERSYPSIQAFTLETVEGAVSTIQEKATSSGYNIDGVTSIGFAWAITQGTSTGHVSIGYQTSMNNSSWTATYNAVSDTSATDYTATDTAITLPPTQWIRWILSTELLNATDTKMSLWFKRKKE